MLHHAEKIPLAKQLLKKGIVDESIQKMNILNVKKNVKKLKF